MVTSWLAHETSVAAASKNTQRLHLAAAALFHLHDWYCKLETAGRYLSNTAACRKLSLSLFFSRRFRVSGTLWDSGGSSNSRHWFEASGYIRQARSARHSRPPVSLATPTETPCIPPHFARHKEISPESPEDTLLQRRGGNAAGEKRPGIIGINS